MSTINILTPIVNNLLTSIFLRVANSTMGRRRLVSTGYNSSIIDDTAYNLYTYEMILRRMAKDYSMTTSNITIGAKGFNAYFLKYPRQFNISDTNISISENKSYALCIYYPYSMSKRFEAPRSYKIGSNALGIMAYGEGRKGKLKKANFSMTFNGTQIYAIEKGKGDIEKVLKKYEILAGCYDRDTKEFKTNICFECIIVNSSVSCECHSIYSMCYLVYRKARLSKKAVISISVIIPSLILIGAAVTLIILIKKGKIRIGRKKPYEEVISEKKVMIQQT